MDMVAERSAWSLETPPLGGLPFQEERGGDSRVGSEAPASVATQIGRWKLRCHVIEIHSLDWRGDATGKEAS